MFEKRNHIKFISSLILFGSNGVVAAHVMLPSGDIVLLRTFIGAIALGLVILLMRGGRRTLGGKANARYILLSGVSMGLSWLFLYEAYRCVGVSVASLQYYCAPVLVMALSPVVFREPLTRRSMISFVVVLAGAIAVNGPVDAGSEQSWGMFCGWMSMLLHAAMVVFSKKGDEADGLLSSFIQLVASFAVTLIFLAVTGGLPFEVGIESWPWAIVLGVVNTGLGCYLYFSSFRSLSAQSVATLGYLEPLSAVVCASVFLGEAMSLAQLLGCVLIVGGAMAGRRSESTMAR